MKKAPSPFTTTTTTTTTTMVLLASSRQDSSVQSRFMFLFEPGGSVLIQHTPPVLILRCVCYFAQPEYFIEHLNREGKGLSGTLLLVHKVAKALVQCLLLLLRMNFRVSFIIPAAAVAASFSLLVGSRPCETSLRAEVKIGALHAFGLFSISSPFFFFHFNFLRM